VVLLRWSGSLAYGEEQESRAASARDLLLGQWAYCVASGSRVPYEARHREGSPGGSCGTARSAAITQGARVQEKRPQGVSVTDRSLPGAGR
jgi:hypothetical protein